MRRVSVVGGSCTGKTTASRELATRLGSLERADTVVHLAPPFHVAFGRAHPHLALIHLRSPREVDELLDSIQPWAAPV